MGTLGTTLQDFFTKLNSSPSPITATINIQQRALQRSHILSLAADPPPGSSSRAILLNAARETYDLDIEESDVLTFLRVLYEDIRKIITSLSQGNMKETATALHQELQEEATTVLKNLRNAKQAIEYRVIVGSLRYDECSTPPFYPRLSKVESPKPEVQVLSSSEDRIQMHTEHSFTVSRSMSLSSIDGVILLQC
ncbi:hypothetical protein EG329_011462 [Mollisiaceae sp. DMI_Dod_QoI]|nr:hypothetical protein EG329_011462 [Helotiales sp. DMI_Dod_QoI]